MDSSLTVCKCGDGEISTLGTSKVAVMSSLAAEIVTSLAELLGLGRYSS